MPVGMMFVYVGWGLDGNREERFTEYHLLKMGFPRGPVVKNPPANAGDARDVGSILRLRRSPGVGNGNLL